MFDPESSAPKMTEAERRRISEFIEREFGIKMPASKKSLLEGRLAKRLQVSGIDSYGGYFDFITKDVRGQDEFLQFADLVSTHETSFFREAGHFDYLKAKVLPSRWAHRDWRALNVLSAACSTGEEAYSLAMLLDSVSRQMEAPAPDFLIEGVDLSDRAVAIAGRGVYLQERLRTVPPDLVSKYIMRSRDRKKNVCRIVPELRSKVRFHTGNLLGDLALSQQSYDLIFCRNVLIYFDPPNQRRVISTLLGRLKSDGLLFLGHAETMISLDLPVKTVSHAVYQKT